MKTRSFLALATTTRYASVLIAITLATGFAEPVGGEVPEGVRVQPLPAGAGGAQHSAAADSDGDFDLAAHAEKLRQSLGRSLVQRRQRVKNARTTAPLAARLGKDVAFRVRLSNGTPMQIKGPVLHARIGDKNAGDDWALATARAFLRANSSLLRLQEPDVELELKRRTTDELGLTHLRFRQRFRGLDVWPAEINVHLDSGGDVYLMDGAYVPTPKLHLVDPIVSAEVAVDLARGHVPRGASAQASHPELVVHARVDRKARLAWKLELELSPTSRWLVVIDAINGARLEAFDDVKTEGASGSGYDLLGSRRSLNVWRQSGTYYLVDTSKPMFDSRFDPLDIDASRGAIMVVDNRNTEEDLWYVTSPQATSWSLADGVSAAFSVSETYDYFHDRHGWNSINGAGGTIFAVVRHDQDLYNAYWNGKAMFFGDADSFAASLDVVAHELTHGVTEYTAGLVYQFQSGALNEAYSDIFGEMTEARSFGSNDWLMGTALSSAIRSLENPGRYGDPATMSEYEDLGASQDHGGVHVNSTIPGHAFYLLAEGLPNSAGRRDAERIFFRSLRHHLTPDSQFVDARLACIQSAEELFGAGSQEARATADAFDGVEIFDASATPDPPTFPPVSGDDSTLFVFYDSQQGGYFLGRREDALGDEALGVYLSQSKVASARASVTGDGSLASYVDSENDACFVATEGGQAESCLGFPGQISSVSMAPDGNRYGFVFLDALGNPDNSIAYIDLAADTTTVYDLIAPTEDAGARDTVLFADVLTFTAGGRYLIYDALNVIGQLGGSQVGAWSIYAIDLLTNNTLDVVPPAEGLDIGFPSLSHTSDRYLTFDVWDQQEEDSWVVTADLNTGEIGVIGIASGVYGVPNFTGDDSAIVFASSTSTPTGASLYRQDLSGDRLAPVGNPTGWLNDASHGVIYRRGTFTGPTPDCTETSTNLCLNGNRFKIEARWEDFEGKTGRGQAVSLTSDTGYFWFFNDANVELVVKVLDGRTFNDHFWVFYGALSNVQYTISVTDTVDGFTKTYTNPPHHFASEGDTGAILSPGKAGSSAYFDEDRFAFFDGAYPFALNQPRPINPLPPLPVAEDTEAVAKGVCTPGSKTLCLNKKRFRVEVTWRDFSDNTGFGRAMGLTDDTGYFWFFNSSNVELVIKVLDGRALNGHFWVFYGALSNVGYTITVTDTERNEVRTYTNPLGDFGSVGDTSAFKVP